MKPKYRILIVEDSAANRDLLTGFLSDIDTADFDVVEAEDGVQALKILGDPDHGVELMVTDLSMPNMDGLELIRHLRAMERGADLPILFLTANADEDRKIEAFRCGATDYVAKPFLAPELESRILGHLERKRAFETIQQNVRQARLTQESLLPQQVPDIPGATLAVKYQPAEHLSGDFYDFYQLPDGRLGILLADVSGHGIAAALVTFVIAAIFKHVAPSADDPRVVMERSSEMLKGKIPPGKYATALYAAYDPSNQTLCYALAGHPPPILMRRGIKTPKALALEGSPLGLSPMESSKFKQETVELQTGDKVIFQTDGVLEATNDEDQQLGLQRLKRFLSANADLSSEQLVESIIEYGRSFVGGATFEDDVTLLAMEIWAQSS